MNPTPQASLGDVFLADCERIHREWDTHARSVNTEGLIALYAQDAILETPLVPAIFDGHSGILRGHREIRPFFEEGARRRPNELVRWDPNRQLVERRQAGFDVGVSPASSRWRSNRAARSDGNRAWPD